MEPQDWLDKLFQGIYNLGATVLAFIAVGFWLAVLWMFLH
jgi:hypothetical protein